MNQIEAAFFYGDFRHLNADTQKFDIEKFTDTRYNVSFSDRKSDESEANKN
jgi:hypothetical protein